MNQFQKIQSQKILASFSNLDDIKLTEGIEIEKGRKPALIGTKDKSGQNIKTADGWKPIPNHTDHTKPQSSSQPTLGDIVVGFKYVSNNLKEYEVVKISGDDAFVVETGKTNPLKNIESKEDILNDIELRTKNHSHRENQNNQEKEQAAKEVEAKNKYKDAKGFTDEMTKIQEGKVIEFLNKQVTIKDIGGTSTIKDAVSKLVENNYEIMEFKNKKYISKDGVFFSSKDLSAKTTIDYFEFLKNK